MTRENQEYPKGVTDIVESLRSITEVDEILAQNRAALEKAKIEQDDPYHHERVKDLEVMVEALEKRRHKLEIGKAA